MFALVFAVGFFVWKAGVAVKHRFCGNQESEIQSNMNNTGPYRNRPSRAGTVKRKQSMDSDATLVQESRYRSRA